MTRRRGLVVPEVETIGCAIHSCQGEGWLSAVAMLWNCMGYEESDVPEPARNASEQNPDPPGQCYRDGSLLRYYRAVNESFPECISYVVGDRGFFAEVTSIARAMSYAWCARKQFVLESGDFAYRFRDGWTDYFEPFCADVAEVDEARVSESFRFDRRRRPGNLKKLHANPGVVRFGTHQLQGMFPAIRHFVRLIFRLSYDAERETRRLREQLGMPGKYVALHIRRGDKVGDEDVFYPVERYFDALDDFERSAVFVLSDDHRTVDEVRDYLASRRRGNRVFSLCRPEHTGFDVWKLRAGDRFAGDGQEFDDSESHRRYVFAETSRLLAETIVASRARQFVSTARSNVGISIAFLHDDPDVCRKIGR